LLNDGHQGVKLSREERNTIACWIDLVVPYCGDYLEANAWNSAEMEKYQHYAKKRTAMEKLEQESIRALAGVSSAIP
jgi:hypothetical protein